MGFSDGTINQQELLRIYLIATKRGTVRLLFVKTNVLFEYTNCSDYTDLDSWHLSKLSKYVLGSKASKVRGVNR